MLMKNMPKSCIAVNCTNHNFMTKKVDISYISQQGKDRQKNIYNSTDPAKLTLVVTFECFPSFHQFFHKYNW